MDTIIRITFFGGLILPPIVFICAVSKLKGLDSNSRFLASSLWACATFSSLMILAWSMFFRDGMGPDSDPETYGIEALEKCWSGIFLAIVIGMILVAFGLMLAIRGKKTSNKETALFPPHLIKK